MARPGNPQVTPGEVVVMASGVVALVASFLPWYTITVAAGTIKRSAWGSGLFPVASLLPLAGIAAALQVALDRLAQVSMRRRYGDFTVEQILLVLALLAALITACFLFKDKGAFDFAPGYWLDLLAAAGLVVGAVMVRKERALSST